MVELKLGGIFTYKGKQYMITHLDFRTMDGGVWKEGIMYQALYDDPERNVVYGDEFCCQVTRFLQKFEPA